MEESIAHILWSNDWNEPARPVAPLAPLLVFAKDENYPLKVPADLVPFDWPTKYGPYRFVEGNTIRYTLPIPPLDTALYLKPEPSPELAKKISKDIANAAIQLPVDWLNDDSLNGWYMWASSGLAYTLLDASQKQLFAAGWKMRLDYSLRPNIWFARKEPFSGLEYPISFGWIERSSDTIGDVNSGIGATLYALWTYARCTGDWKFVEERWPTIKKAAEYFIVEHDWAQMQTGAREHSASSAIDMDGIGYEGAVAFANMAATLGREDEAAFGRLLVSRMAVPTCLRWLGVDWVRPGLGTKDHSAWNGVGVGLSEVTGFDILEKGEGGPNHANSELALSLSWVGQFPELYSLHLWGLGEPFWQWFEYQYVEKQIQDWRKQYTGTRNNHQANIIAHLYMRHLLGEPASKQEDELEKQGSWAKDLAPYVSRENAGFYSMLFGADAPVVLLSWGEAGILNAEYDAQSKIAKLEFNSGKPFLLRMKELKQIQKVTLGNNPVSLERSSDCLQISVPAGNSVLLLSY